MGKGAPGVRYAEVEREAAGLRVRVVVDLAGGTKRDVATGLVFFDRLIVQMAYQAHIDLGVQVEGPVQADDHSVLKEVGIALGQALRAALIQSEAAPRCASSLFVKDDALVQIALDTGGRGQLFYEVAFDGPSVGSVSTQSLREFFRGIVIQAGFTAHVRKLAGDNDHHVFEALCKGFGQALHGAAHGSDR